MVGNQANCSFNTIHRSDSKRNYRRASSSYTMRMAMMMMMKRLFADILYGVTFHATKILFWYSPFLALDRKWISTFLWASLRVLMEYDYSLLCPDFYALIPWEFLTIQNFLSWSWLKMEAHLQTETPMREVVTLASFKFCFRCGQFVTLLPYACQMRVIVRSAQSTERSSRYL
jgi:hypothetical protein